jgi:putative effector of murein hydrolase
MGDLLIAVAAVVGTVAVYAVALRLRRRFPSTLLHPVLLSMLAIAGSLLLLGIDYRTYDRGGWLLTSLLGPAVVALAVAGSHR